MKAIDVLKRNNMVLLYCGGDDISADFQCKKIKIMEQIFNVIKVGVYNSIGDVKAVLIQIDAKESQPIPLGDIIVIK
jgi:hypothetical protein